MTAQHSRASRFTSSPQMEHGKVPPNEVTLEYYGLEVSDDFGPSQGLCELIFAKNRGGRTGTAPMRFHAPTTSFSPWDDMPQTRSLPFAAPVDMTSVRSPMPKSEEFDAPF